MAFKTPLPTTRLVYTGIFDLDKLYKTLRTWFIERDYELVETQYKHKVPSPAGAEEDIRWSAWRKVTGIILFRINIYIKLYDMKAVEVVKEGSKQKMTKSRLMIEFEGVVEVDYSKKWGGSKFMDGLQRWFYTFVYREPIENVYQDELYYTVYKVYTVAKETLDMESKYYRSKGRY